MNNVDVKGLVINDDAGVCNAIIKLQSGNSVIFYECDPFRAIIATPIKSVDDDLLYKYVANSGYIILSKEKINSLYGIDIAGNGLIALSKFNFRLVFEEIKSSFSWVLRSSNLNKVAFDIAGKIHDMAVMLSKEAEEIPVLLACGLHFDNLKNLRLFAFENAISLVSYQEYLKYKNSFVLNRLSVSKLALKDVGEVWLHLYKDTLKHHCAVVMDNLGFGVWNNPIVRIHSSCYTGDVMGSMQCDCHDQLHKSMQLISQDYEGGLLIYLNQEGRGIGLDNKLKSYSLQRCGIDTVDANNVLGFRDDERDFSVAAQILKSFNIKRMRLLSNNPSKLEYFSKVGIILEDLPILTKVNLYNKRYMETKMKKMGHKIFNCAQTDCV